MTAFHRMAHQSYLAISAIFNTSLELSERPGTLICFDFQAEVLRSYCGSRVRFQTIDFTKFEGRLFP